MITWGSAATSSTKDSATVGTTEYSCTTSAPSNSGRGNSLAVPPSASSTTGRTPPSEYQPHTTPAAPPTSPAASSSTGSTERTTPIHETQEERFSTAITTTSEGTTLPNSMMTSTLKNQRGTSGSTASSGMATSASPSEQNQSAPAAAPFAASSVASGLESSVSTDSPMSATITAPMALNSPGNDVTSSGPMTTTASEKSATATPPATLDAITDVKESLPVTTSAVTHSTLLTMTTLGTTDLGTNMPGIQEGVNTAAPPTPTTSPMMSTLSERHHNTITQTPSHPVESAPSAGTAMAQSPETTAAHSTALIPSSSGPTKSSARTGASQASPKHTGSNSPGAGVCALDEYLADKGVCVCNNSYYAHSELSRALVALQCQPQEIEVVLSSCFLKTRPWMLGEGAFSGCSSVSKTEERRSVQVFTMEKKEGTCGLCLSVSNLGGAL
ncbi:mucin-2-like [Hippopotamus amphibius kiboko]|uniref:mucin-2-like n=1 Tax=Hippopotamus amphibius kiboko TaxID=575201 RepID=UPI0025915C77|nr:mucin-2-like [Hippopotamus amphibius kiboko]